MGGMLNSTQPINDRFDIVKDIPHRRQAKSICSHPVFHGIYADVENQDYLLRVSAAAAAAAAAQVLVTLQAVENPL